MLASHVRHLLLLPALATASALIHAFSAISDVIYFEAKEHVVQDNGAGVVQAGLAAGRYRSRGHAVLALIKHVLELALHVGAAGPLFVVQRVRMLIVGGSVQTPLVRGPDFFPGENAHNFDRGYDTATAVAPKKDCAVATLHRRTRRSSTADQVDVLMPQQPHPVLKELHRLLAGNVGSSVSGSAEESTLGRTLKDQRAQGGTQPMTENGSCGESGCGAVHAEAEAAASLRVLFEGSYQEPAVMRAGAGRSNPHVQTIYASAIRPKVFAHLVDDMQFVRERLRSSLDGGMIVLDWFSSPAGTATRAQTPSRHSASGRPVVLIVPGICSSSESFYVRRQCQVLYDLAEVQPVIYHPRACADEMDSAVPKLFTFADSHDLHDTLEYLCNGDRSNRESDAMNDEADEHYSSGKESACSSCGFHRDRTRVICAAFSLGTNPLLSLLGSHRQTNTDRRSTCTVHSDSERFIASAIAVSGGYDALAGLLHLEKTPFYDRGLTAKLKGVVCDRHRDVFAPLVGDFAKFDNVKGVRDFDTVFTLHHRADELGVSNVTEFYEKSSSKHALRHITVPTMTVNAEDDPLVPLEALRHAQAELVEFSQHGACMAVSTPFGGHLGWCEGSSPSETHWHERVTANWCRATVKVLEDSAGHCTSCGRIRPSDSGAPLLRVRDINARTQRQ